MRRAVAVLLMACVMPACTKVDNATAERTRKEPLRPLIYVDEETGCHYVSGTGGTLTPRMDASRAQVCT